MFLDAEDGEGCHRSKLPDTPRRLSTISGVYSLHITAGGDVVRGLLQAGGGQGHPCLSGAKTVGDALRTLPANVASGTLMPSVSAFVYTWGHTPIPPFFGVKVSDDLIGCHRPLSCRSEDFVEVVLSHPAKCARLSLRSASAQRASTTLRTLSRSPPLAALRINAKPLRPVLESVALRCWNWGYVMRTGRGLDAASASRAAALSSSSHSLGQGMPSLGRLPA